MGKIISIDVWGTLIKGSPTFKPAKYDLVRGYFGNDLSDDVIEHAFNKSKRALNDIIETTGWQPSNDQIYRVLFNNLGITYSSPSNKYNLYDFRKDYQQLAEEHTPLIYGDVTLDSLDLLIDYGHTLIISSNTMFISGGVLEKYLTELGVMNRINHCKFSDQVGYSKPHISMFGNSDFHIGDNPLTDGEGPKNMGIDYFLINSNNKTIQDATDHFLSIS